MKKRKFPLFEDVISNNTQETQKISEFSPNYQDLEFELSDVENRNRRLDTLTGTYKSKDEYVEVSVSFFENESGSWAIKISGFNSESSSSIDSTFEYPDFESMVNILKTTFLNIESTDDLNVWICGNSYILTRESDY